MDTPQATLRFQCTRGHGYVEVRMVNATNQTESGTIFVRCGDCGKLMEPVVMVPR